MEVTGIGDGFGSDGDGQGSGSTFVLVQFSSSQDFAFQRRGRFLVMALIGLVTFRPLNRVTGHVCHQLLSRQMSASYALPFSTVPH